MAFRPLSLGILALLAAACTCGPADEPAPAEPSFDVPPLDAEAVLDPDPLLVRAIDDTRAVVVTREAISEPTRLALVEDGAPRWSRRLPCDGARAGILDVSANAEQVVVRCAVGVEPGVVGTFALATEGGALRWRAESGSAGGLPGAALTTLQAPGLVIGVGGPAGLEVRDAATGERRWAREGRYDRVEIVGDAVLALGSTDDLFLDAESGEPVSALEGWALGALEDGVCVIGERGLQLVGREGTRTLAEPEQVSALVDAGMKPENWGLRIQCGLHGDRTVVLADAGPHNLIAVLEEGADPRIVRLPRTSGPPRVRGWERELPRYVALRVEPRTLVVVDLDEARIAYTLDVPFPRRFESAGEMLLVRARVGDRFVLSNDGRLVAIDGSTSEITAEERPLALSMWWLDLPRAVAGDVLWTIRTEDGATRVEPARFSADGAIARDWWARRDVRDGSAEP